MTGSYKDVYTRWYMKIPSALTSNYADYLKLWRFRYSDSTGGQAVLDFRYGAFPGIINIFLVTGTGHQPTGPLFTPSVDGQWHCYEVRMKLNSAAGVYDGAMQGWKDGTLTYSDTAVNWDATSTSVFISTGLGIGNRADNVVFQNSWQAIEMDDYVLSTTPIGCTGPPSAYCGDLSCNGAETCSTCPEDCGACQTCGNNLREGSEVCDGSDLAGQTCISRGFTGGTLACLSSCSGFDTSGCTNPTCGNTICDPGETCSNCPGDCGQCQVQGVYIFQDSLPSGAGISQGDPMQVSTESPYQGTNSLKITGQGAWSNCRIINLNLSVQNIDWPNAYLEFALNSSVPSSYVAVNLWGDGTQAPEQAFALSGSGQYETFRINMTGFSPTQPGFGNA
ncbi:MAG: hypothetical protein MUP55_02900, partial [Candidatus Aenigmarchaeota archaeon]|nr:hypothetical protein [Candidatus Aenigmarchaeota archaeon]